MKLIISNVSGIPIYEQIKQQIKAAILSGELQAEETLPSLRTLAKDLKEQRHRCGSGRGVTLFRHDDSRGVEQYDSP